MAAAFLFRRERHWVLASTYVPIAVACAMPILIVATDSRKAEAYGAFVAGVLALVARTVAKPQGAARRRQGVEELEERDCHIFNLRWNHGLGERPLRESTKRNSAAGRKKLPAEVSKVATWYEFVDQVPDERNVLVAQRSNLAWGETAHRRWANLLALFLVAIVCFGAVFAALGDDSLIIFLGVIAFPSVPGLIELWELAALHRLAGSSKEAKRREVERLLETGDTSRARELQDDIFRSRLEHPHVPNWYHRLFRARDDDAMREAAHDFAAP